MRLAGLRISLLAIALSLAIAAAFQLGLGQGPIEGHLASQVENAGNRFEAAADFEEPDG